MPELLLLLPPFLLSPRSPSPHTFGNTLKNTEIIQEAAEDVLIKVLKVNPKNRHQTMVINQPSISVIAEIISLKFMILLTSQIWLSLECAQGLQPCIHSGYEVCISAKAPQPKF